MATLRVTSTPLTATIPDMSVISGLGQNKIRELIRDGQLKTIAIGTRRLVVVASFQKLIDDELNSPPKDARRNAAVPALFTKQGPGRPRKKTAGATP